MLDKIDERKLSYILGFLQGDGHHGESTRNRGRIVIELNYGDIDILEKIQQIITPYINVKLKSRIRDTNFKKCYSSVTLSVYDLEFREQIKKYIPVGSKSNIIEPPTTLPKFSKRDYIRGLVDADGSVGISKNNIPFISLCVSSEKIKEFLIQDIENITGVKKEINRNKRDNVYNIMLNNEQAVIYSNYLYQNTDLYLNRKYNIYLSLLKWTRNESIKKRENVKKWSLEEDLIVLNNDISLLDKMEALKRTSNSISTRIWRLKK